LVPLIASGSILAFSMLQAASCKLQAASCKLQAASCKLQAASCKLQAAFLMQLETGDQPCVDNNKIATVHLLQLKPYNSNYLKRDIYGYIQHLALVHSYCHRSCRHDVRGSRRRQQ
jgi:hypothetical protein